MNRPVVECVPNFSEGRDRKKIDRIVEAIGEVAGARVLDVDPGQETNRTVVTFVGTPEVVEEAAFRAIRRAAELIDMSIHQGAHPRHGATDVCPFVPVSGVTMSDCVAIAERVGERVGRELEIPVFLYEHAARTPARRSLAAVRAGEYEALADKLARPEWRPDFGPARFLPRTGVVTIGAREFLIAYNIDLNTTRKDAAEDLAGEIRETGRAKRLGSGPWYASGNLVRYEPSAGRLPCGYCDLVSPDIESLGRHHREVHRMDLAEELAFFKRKADALEGVNVMRRGHFENCRAVGWLIPEYGRAQISINLTDYTRTPAHVVLEKVRALAAERGLVVTGSEIVGLVPYPAMRQTAEFYLERQDSTRGLPVKDLMETAIQSMGLRDVAAFDAESRVLGLPKREGPLVAMRIGDLADEVSRPSPAPGGGSIAALAGALGAALAAMVGNLSFAKKGLEDRRAEMEGIARRAQELKDGLLQAIDDDTDAFNDVLAAMKLPKATAPERSARDAAIETGYKQATMVPLRTAELSLEAVELARDAARRGMSSSASDAGVGAMMARTACLGALMNVRINLGQIRDAAWVAATRERLDRMEARCEELEREAREAVRAHMGA